MLQPRSSEKKLVKHLKIFFGPNLHRKEVIMGHVQDGKKSFLVKITMQIISFQKVPLILSKYDMF